MLDIDVLKSWALWIYGPSVLFTNLPRTSAPRCPSWVWSCSLVYALVPAALLLWGTPVQSFRSSRVHFQPPSSACLLKLTLQHSTLPSLVSQLHCLTMRLDCVAVLRGGNITGLSIYATRTSFEVPSCIPDIRVPTAGHQLDLPLAYQGVLLVVRCKLAIATLQAVLG